MNFAAKTPVSEAPDKGPYTQHWPHTQPMSSRAWTGEFVDVASIDPARKNYALRIERRHASGEIVMLAFDKVDLDPAYTNAKSPGGGEFVAYYQNCTLFLKQHLATLSECHYIIIERQLPENYVSTRIAQHTVSLLSVALEDAPHLPIIYEVDPKLKGKVLGYPPHFNKRKLKLWSICIARQMLAARGDQESLLEMDKWGKKQDDLADTVLQVQALFITWGLCEDNSAQFAFDEDFKVDAPRKARKARK